MRKYINSAFVYAILAMIGGVFYREFTKFHGFTGQTTLGVVHAHYFVLGMVVFLLLLLMEKNFNFTKKNTDIILVLYHVGLNLAVLAFIVRGITEVKSVALSSGMNFIISGVAGIGHILVAIGLVALLIQIKRKVSEAEY